MQTTIIRLLFATFFVAIGMAANLLLKEYPLLGYECTFATSCIAVGVVFRGIPGGAWGFAIGILFVPLAVFFVWNASLFLGLVI